MRFWGVGNESWGCGGNLTPQEYAVEFRRFATWVPRYGQELSLVASGPNSDEWSWTRGFFEELLRKGKEQLDSVYGLSLHHYAANLGRGKIAGWEESKGDALRFDPWTGTSCCAKASAWKRSSKTTGASWAKPIPRTASN